MFLEIQICPIKHKWNWITHKIKISCKEEEFRNIKLLLQRIDRLEHCAEQQVYLITMEQYKLLKQLDINLIKVKEEDILCH